MSEPATIMAIVRAAVRLVVFISRPPRQRVRVVDVGGTSPYRQAGTSRQEDQENGPPSRLVGRARRNQLFHIGDPPGGKDIPGVTAACAGARRERAGRTGEPGRGRRLEDALVLDVRSTGFDLGMLEY